MIFQILIIENIVFKKLMRPLIFIMDLKYQKMNNIWHMEVVISCWKFMI